MFGQFFTGLNYKTIDTNHSYLTEFQYNTYNSLSTTLSGVSTTIE